MALVISTWANNPITINGAVTPPEWNGAGVMPIPAGFLMAKNDANFLYVALDLVGDLGADAGTGDYFWFTADTDANAAITPHHDLNYGLLPGAPNLLRRQYYVGPGVWTGVLNEITSNQTHIGFGPTSHSAVPHRVWEMRIKLSELGVDMSDPASLKVVRFGVRVASTTPPFTFDYPATFYTNFTNLHTIALALSPTLPPGLAGAVIGTVGFIPTTNISADGFATSALPPLPVEAAFGGSMNFHGNQVTMLSLWGAGARKYKIVHRPGTSGAFTPMRQSWGNYHWNGSTYILEPFGPDASDNYPLTNPSEEYSLKNLLLSWNSVGETPGIHQFQARFLRNDGTTVVASTPQTVSLMVDNNQADVQIINILHNTVPVPACAIETMLDNTDGLQFRITANDVEGHLQGYSLNAYYGDNLSATIVSDTYAAHMNPAHLWSGVINALAPTVGEWVPPISCAYQFRVSAWPRVTNGYGWIGGVEFNRHVTIIKPGGGGPALLPFLSREFPLGMSGKKGPDVAGKEPAKLGSGTFGKVGVGAGGAQKTTKAKKTTSKKTGSKKAAAKKPAGKKASPRKKR